MSLEDTENKVAACEKESKDLREDTLFLRTEHLQEMLDKARKKGDKNKEKALLTMLRKEHGRRQNG